MTETCPDNILSGAIGALGAGLHRIISLEAKRFDLLINNAKSFDCSSARSS